jgi:hypothetical protein
LLIERGSLLTDCQMSAESLLELNIPSAAKQDAEKWVSTGIDFLGG